MSADRKSETVMERRMISSQGQDYGLDAGGAARGTSLGTGGPCPGACTHEADRHGPGLSAGLRAGLAGLRAGLAGLRAGSAGSAGSAGLRAGLAGLRAGLSAGLRLRDRRLRNRRLHAQRADARRGDVAALLPLLLAAAVACGPGEGVDPALLADAVTPAEHERGRAVFDAHCVVCHGEMALGTDAGPPLVHSVYRMRHHGDDAFRIAVTRGVRAHHWRFGDMPAVPGVDEADIEDVIRYVRWLQRTAGME
jgi:mono/diheme cytochrome c family protein